VGDGIMCLGREPSGHVGADYNPHFVRIIGYERRFRLGFVFRNGTGDYLRASLFVDDEKIPVIAIRDHAERRR